MKQLVDLHSHSFASPDGFGYPGDVARHFQRQGHRAFALTDHNSVRGHEQAAAASAECGIEFIPGVEMASSTLHLPEFHGGGGQDILCYFFDHTAAVLDLMEPPGYAQLDNIHAVITTIAEAGLADISRSQFDDHIRSHYGSEYLGWRGIRREALCDLLIEHQLLNPAQAEERGFSLSEWRRQAALAMIRQYTPAAAANPPAREDQKVEHVCKVMRDAGAVLIMAHPGRGKREPSAAERQRIHLWLEHFVDGVEVYHHGNSPEYREMLLEVARRHNRPWTGGGDRHNYTATEGHVSEASVECLDLLAAWRKVKG